MNKKQYLVSEKPYADEEAGESYLFSNFEKAKEFAEEFAKSNSDTEIVIAEIIKAVIARKEATYNIIWEE